MQFVKSAGLQTWQPEAQGTHPALVNAYPCKQSEHTIELLPLTDASYELAQLSIGWMLKVLAIFDDNSHVLLLIMSTYPWTQAEHSFGLLLVQDVQGKEHDTQTELFPMKVPG